MNTEPPHDVIPVPPADDAPVAPVRVSLGELVAASRAPAAAVHEQRVAQARAAGHVTPAGLPRGYQWVPHDTGKLGYAAARRRAQMARQQAKQAARLRRDLGDYTGREE